MGRVLTGIVTKEATKPLLVVERSVPSHVPAVQVAQDLEDLAWLVALSASVALHGPQNLVRRTPAPSGRPLHPNPWLRRLQIEARALARERSSEPPRAVEQANKHAIDVELVQVRYGSPLEIVIHVAPIVTAVGSAMTVLVYGIKRLYGLDFEFKTQREVRRREYLEAKRLADAAARELRPAPNTSSILDAIDEKRRKGVPARSGRATLIDEQSDKDEETDPNEGTDESSDS